MNRTRTAFWRPVRAADASPLSRPEPGLVRGLLVETSESTRVGLDPRGVAHDEDDADGRPDDEDDQPPDDALLDRDTGESRGDARGERVDRRAEDADAAAEQQDRRGDSES